LAPCSANLATPAVKKSTANFNIATYTGNSGTQAITGLGMHPDLVWIKDRTSATNHGLHDTVRSLAWLASNSNLAESSGASYVSAVGTDGFTVNANSAGNYSGNSYVGWCWKAGGDSPSKTYTVKVVSDSGNKYRFDDYGTSAVTINLQEGGTYTFDQSDSSNSGHPFRFSTTSDGSHGGGSEYTTGVTTNGTPGSSGAYTRITVAASAATLYYYCTAHSGMGGQANTNSAFGSTNFDGAALSTVSVNTTAGFSIIKAEGTGSSTTYGHGLGVVPKVYIIKLISDTGDWYLQTSALDGGWDYFQLNGTAAPASMSATAPTSSVITGNITDGETAIYYAWAEVEGFSRFGNYIGNGNTDGVFVNCGFRPAYVLFKNHGSSAWWWVHDTARNPLNPATLILFPNATSADYTSGSNGVDFLSNGIKLRADNDLNGSGQNVFFMAFAEFPFKYANSR
jgi:hypothetical protein